MRVPPAIAQRRAQHGVILFIALIVLVAMSLAGVALMRSVDTNVMIAGNLAFRQGATLAGDRAFEDPADGARAFLLHPANKEYLKVDQGGGNLFYWANWQSNVNILTDFDWFGPGVKIMPDDLSGNEVRYVIHRMCKFAGSQDSLPTPSASRCPPPAATRAPGARWPMASRYCPAPVRSITASQSGFRGRATPSVTFRRCSIERPPGPWRAS